MLCLDCHKIVDELESRFPAEKMQAWKYDHSRRIASNFSIPTINNEKELLIEISYLLDTNRAIFEEYGPFSTKAMNGDSGDARKI